MTRYGGLSRWWWDKVLDGNTYRLVSHGLPGNMPLSILRARAYKEADNRGRILQTHWPKRYEAALYVQAVPIGQSDQFTYLGDHNSALPMPLPTAYLSRPPVKVALTEEEEDMLLLGPCTCGQAPKCLPSCARAGGPATGPLPPSWTSRDNEPGPVGFPPALS